MVLRLEYHDEEEKNIYINEQASNGLTLVELQNHFDGNFVVFSDNPTEYLKAVEMITIPKEDYESLQNQLLLAVNENIEGGIF